MTPVQPTTASTCSLSGQADGPWGEPFDLDLNWNSPFNASQRVPVMLTHSAASPPELTRLAIFAGNEMGLPATERVIQSDRDTL